MNLTDKMAYLRGMVDGMELDLTTTKEGKVLGQLLDVMQEMTAYVTDLQTQVDELTEVCDLFDQDLGDLENQCDRAALAVIICYSQRYAFTKLIQPENDKLSRQDFFCNQRCSDPYHDHCVVQLFLFYDLKQFFHLMQSHWL